MIFWPEADFPLKIAIRPAKFIYMTTNQTASLSHLSSLGRKMYVISDLHLASGLNSNANYEGTENFYADYSFVRFLDHLQKNSNGSSVLIINGDFIDFLRICEYPDSREGLLQWQSLLKQVQIEKQIEDLERSIDKKEKKFGLKTNDYKTVWKLHVCIHGHPVLFKRIAQWLLDGNDLVIVKGNHDLEWYWPVIQDIFRHSMSELAIHSNEDNKNLLPQSITQQIHFVDDALLIDGRIYIEHGHRYERTTYVEGSAVMKNNPEELALPFGSFFNRYLINRLEFAYPYLDNVRPQQNILPVLLRERFPLGVKILFQYIPFTLLIIPKKMYWYVFKYLLNIVFIIVLPIAITGFAIYQQVIPGLPSNTSSPILQQAFSIAKNFGFLFLSYLFGRLLSMAGLKAPPSLSVASGNILKEYPQVEAILMGHTHDPEQKHLGNNKWYFNTGTWIPIFETSSADVRQDKTYTFITIDLKEKYPCRERLQRWNDDALRIESMILNDKK